MINNGKMIKFITMMSLVLVWLITNNDGELHFLLHIGSLVTPDIGNNHIIFFARHEYYNNITN